MPYGICLVCGTEFYVKPSHKKLGWGKYCSKNCQTKSQFKGSFQNCTYCHKRIYRSLSKTKHSKTGLFFCDNSCRAKWRNPSQSGKNHPNWTGGINAYRHILLRSEQKRTCILCNIDDIRILSAHHIDHNRQNNELSNLTWLCLNCHYLVHHDAGMERYLKKQLRLS
jgi:hypothetical protein